MDNSLSITEVTDLVFYTNPYKITIRFCDNSLFIEASHEEKMLTYQAKYDDVIPSNVLKGGYTTKMMYNIFNKLHNKSLDAIYSIEFPKNTKSEKESIVIEFKLLFDNDIGQDYIPLYLTPYHIPLDERNLKILERLNNKITDHDNNIIQIKETFEKLDNNTTENTKEIIQIKQTINKNPIDIHDLVEKYDHLIGVNINLLERIDNLEKAYKYLDKTNSDLINEINEITNINLNYASLKNELIAGYKSADIAMKKNFIATINSIRLYINKKLTKMRLSYKEADENIKKSYSNSIKELEENITANLGTMEKDIAKELNDIKTNDDKGIINQEIVEIKNICMTIVKELETIQLDYITADKNLKTDITKAYMTADKDLKSELTIEYTTADNNIKTSFIEADQVLKSEVINAYTTANKTLKGEMIYACTAADNALKTIIKKEYIEADNNVKTYLKNEYMNGGANFFDFKNPKLN